MLIVLLKCLAAYAWTGCAISLIVFWRVPLMFPVASRIAYALLWPLALIPIPDSFVDKYGRGAVQ